MKTIIITVSLLATIPLIVATVGVLVRNRRKAQYTKGGKQ